MKYLSIILYCLFASNLLGQDTLTNKVFPEGGNEFVIDIVLLEESEVPFQILDTNSTKFNYNFNSFNVSYRDTQIFKFTKDADGGKDVPNSEYAYKASFGNGFFRRDSNILNMVGISPDDDNLPFVIGFPFDSTIAHFITPLKLGDEYIDATTASEDFGLFKLKFKISVEYKVNGYGRLTTPDDSTFEVLRLWRKFIYEVKTTPIFGEPSTTIDSLITWEYYNKDIKNTILRVDARPTGNDTVWHFDFFVKDITKYTSAKKTLKNEEIENKSRNVLRIKELDNMGNMNYNVFKIFDLGGREFEIGNNEMKEGFYILILKDKSNGSLVSSKVYISR